MVSEPILLQLTQKLQVSKAHTLTLQDGFSSAGTLTSSKNKIKSRKIFGRPVANPSIFGVLVSTHALTTYSPSVNVMFPIK